MIEERDVSVAELLAEVRRIEVQSRRLATDVMAGGYSSVFRGAGVEFDEVREYVEGDDPRSVDWNVTARVGRPFVKLYVDERELTVFFLLDLSRSMRGGFGAWSARGTAARVLACLALSAIRNNDKVGFVGFDDGVTEVLPPRKGTRHVLRIVRDALATRSGSGGSDPAAALDLVARASHRRAVVFVISDFLHPVESWRRAIARCARRHDVVAVRIVPPETQSRARGLWSVRDPETDEEALIDWRHAPSRERFEERRRAWSAAVEEALSSGGVDLVDVAIPEQRDPDAFVRPILAFFRARELRGRKR